MSFFGKNIKLLGVGVTTLCMSLTCFATSPPSSGNLYQAVDKATVCIDSKVNDSTSLLGTGFFIAPGLLVTAAHQVVTARTITIHFKTGTTTKLIAATPVAIDSPHDLALLSVQLTGHPILPVGDSRAVPLGEEVFTIGCPLGLEHSLTRGVVSNSRRELEGKVFIQTDLTINKGNSGGALVNKSGQVLGIIHGRLRESAQINFAIPSEFLTQLIGRYKQSLANKVNPQIAEMDNHAENTANLKSNQSSDVDTPERVTLHTHFNNIARYPDAAVRVRLLKNLFQTYPENPEIYYMMGVNFFELRQMPQAKFYLQQAITRKPDFHQAYSSLGLTLYYLGEMDAARTTLLKAIELNPNYEHTYISLGIVYSQGFGNNDAAAKVFKKYIELKPKSKEAAFLKRWLIQNNYVN